MRHATVLMLLLCARVVYAQPQPAPPNPATPPAEQAPPAQNTPPSSTETGDKPSDDKPSDDKPSDDKATDNKATDNKATDNKATDETATDDTPTDAPTNDEHKKKKKHGKKGKLVDISGFIQIFYKQRFETNGDGTHEPSVFRDQRVRLTFKGEIRKHVTYKIELDPRSPLLAGVLRDAYIQIAKVIPYHKIRVGQMKTTFGYEAMESSSRLYTVNRAVVSDNLAHGINGRDLGIGLFGKFALKERLTLEDDFTVVNGSGLNVQADDTHRKNLWGRVGVRYDNADEGFMVRLGISGGYGDQTEPADTTVTPPVPGFVFVFKRIGADLEIDHKYAWFAAEYISSSESSQTMPDADGTKYGYYAILVGKFPHQIGPLVRYDVLEDFKRFTFGAFWGAPTNRLRFLTNYEIQEDSTGKHDHKLYLWTQGRF